MEIDEGVPRYTGGLIGCSNPVPFGIPTLSPDGAVNEFTPMQQEGGVLLQYAGQQLGVGASQLQLVSCCICGLQVPANPSGTCETCLKSETDATSGIERNLVLPYCKHCNRYQRPPWLACEWESRELLALCLKRIRGLQGNKRDSRLVDAKFLYTEPHSRRIKLKLTLQREVVASTIVEQDCVIEFVIQPTQCFDCKRAFTPHTWTAIVQVRQRVDHKKSLMYLEQLILKHRAHDKVLKVVEAPDGLDFQFASKSNATRFAQFVASVIPSRCGGHTKQLISHDSKSNTAFHKHTIPIEVCPVSKDDLIFLPRKIVGNIYGGISPFLLCSRVAATIQLIDPFTLRGIDVSNDKYWRYPFEPILVRRHLTEFVVLDIEPVDMRGLTVAAHSHRCIHPSGKRTKERTTLPSGSHPDSSSENDVTMVGTGDDCARSLATSMDSSGGVFSFSDPRVDSSAGRLVDVEIARASDFGINDNRLIVRSHLGKTLRVGQWCLGYDLGKLNFSGMDEESGIQQKLPYEVILVRKARQLGATARTRNWVLQRLPLHKEAGGPSKPRENAKMEFEEFKKDLEEDEVMKQNVNLWRPRRSSLIGAGDAVDTEQEDNNSLCAMLEGLTIKDQEDEDEEYTYE